MNMIEFPDPRVQESVPFLHVEDMSKSVHFYVDQLGFRIVSDWRPNGELRWCRLEHGRVAIMLQTFRPGHVPPARGVGISVSFTCEDALAVHYRCQRVGLDCPKPFVGNGLWVVALEDPDGYRIEFQSPTDVPEGTTYSG